VKKETSRTREFYRFPRNERERILERAMERAIESDGRSEYREV
jgi:hypothetical protein